MILMVVLAAGSARRFGGNKLMWPVEGKPMARHIMDILGEIRRETGWGFTVVTQDGPVADMAKKAGANVVLNPRHEEGISTSIHAALDSFGTDFSHAVFFVADQPYITKSTVIGFINGYLDSGKGLGCVAFGGESGNPCAFSEKYFPQLREITGDRGGKKIIKQHPEDGFVFEAADGRELFDIDTRN